MSKKVNFLKGIILLISIGTLLTFIVSSYHSYLNYKEETLKNIEQVRGCLFYARTQLVRPLENNSQDANAVKKILKRNGLCELERERDLYFFVTKKFTYLFSSAPKIKICDTCDALLERYFDENFSFLNYIFKNPILLGGSVQYWPDCQYMPRFRLFSNNELVRDSTTRARIMEKISSKLVFSIYPLGHWPWDYDEVNIDIDLNKKDLRIICPENSDSLLLNRRGEFNAIQKEVSKILRENHFDRVVFSIFIPIAKEMKLRE